MNARIRTGALIACGALLLGGCASSPTATRPSSTSPPMTPGMVMPDGSTMGASQPNAAAADAPSAAEKMICAAETRTDIAKVLGLKASPIAKSTWVDHRYTCTYALPMGVFVVSVQRSNDPSSAMAYFTSLRTTLGHTQPLDGLGQGSYRTASGKVVLIKDSDTLLVDASRLPAMFGAQQSQRADFAYEIASDILGCWTGG